MDIKKALMKKFIYFAIFAFAMNSAFAHGNEDHHGGKQLDHAAMMGKPGNPAKVSRTIVVDMNDTRRFTPSHVQVKRGETIKFIAKNSGKIKHEMGLGSAKELKGAC